MAESKENPISDDVQNTLANWPPVSDELIAKLEQAVPEKCIRIGQSEAEAHRYAGRRDLVLFLKVIAKHQQS